MRVRSGNILPLALIMTVTILLAGIGIGQVVLRGSQRAKSTDQSVAAYYLADSGIERQLFEVRKNNQTLAYINTLGGNYENGGSWVSTGGIEQVTDKVIPVIEKDALAVVDLFDPDHLDVPSEIASMHLMWETDPACTTGPAASIEVSYGYWKVVGGVPQLPEDNTYIVLPKDASGDLMLKGLDPKSAYRVRLRSFDCSAINMKIVFANDSGQPKPSPGDLTLSAEGSYGQATQKIAVTMPKLDILSNVFGFVLFSECSLIKGNDAQICPK